jgi:hypothetical protein
MEVTCHLFPPTACSRMVGHGVRGGRCELGAGQQQQETLYFSRFVLISVHREDNVKMGYERFKKFMSYWDAFQFVLCGVSIGMTVSASRATNSLKPPNLILSIIAVRITS